ncbi:PLD nuclease N-terminal domain-containing protein [Agromyces sp. MMS24-JH15]|uniref:PLD nuclease N-terminal domain-containing protein n=1 Tax=Agromyces sp. MMS24-JH15 TaxID=3243765 RepID=UPI003749E0CE
MVRVLFGLGVAAAVFMIYSVVDCALFDRTRIRGLARGWWLVVIILVPVIGGILWFAIGRGRMARVDGRQRGPVAPDDDPDFLRRLDRDAAQEERIRKLEQELADLDLDDEPEHGEDAGHPDPGADGTRHRSDPGADGATGDAGPAGRPNA